MTLTEYFKRHHELTKREFANGIDTHEATVFALVNGRCPSLGMAIKIEKYTDGEVTVYDLYKNAKKKEKK